jgi:hypothetical protein
VDLNGDGVADLASSNQVMIAWNPGMGGWMPNGVGTAFDNEPKPLLKPGNYLLDARDLSWYRIQSIDSFDETTSPATAVLSLDRTVRLLTPGDGSGPPALPDPVGRAILMRGVIEVFDL